MKQACEILFLHHLLPASVQLPGEVIPLSPLLRLNLVL